MSKPSKQGSETSSGREETTKALISLVQRVNYPSINFPLWDEINLQRVGVKVHPLLGHQVLLVCNTTPMPITRSPALMTPEFLT